MRLRPHAHLALTLTSGVLLGVVCFDLLPELFALAERQQMDARKGMTALVAGFVLLFGIGRFAIATDASSDPHHHPRIGLISAAALVGHSFADGIGIGLAFRISAAMGSVVAAAVIAHDFADGFNTVSLMVTHANSRGRALVLLMLDSLAPVCGTMLALSVAIPERLMTLYLGFFAGCLLHICTTHLSPEEDTWRGSPLVEIALICAGVAFACLVQAAFS
ncbi:MAG TPA: ZIP family metal transporter [Candidatus Binatia bacterium]|nr:ZIP family metal transporter [Candidatus Binatia bacterium]